MSATDPLPEETGYWSYEHLSAMYDLFWIGCRYQYRSGAYQQNVSGPTTPISVTSTGIGSGIVPAELVQLESPSMNVRVVWRGRRLNAMPSVPNPFPPVNAPFTLMDYDFGSEEEPKLVSDGHQYAFTLSGIYNYSLYLPILPGDGYQLGSAPYQTLPTNVFVIGVSQFRDTIFNLSNISG